MESKIHITTQAACVDDKGDIWFFSNDINALFYFNLEGKIKYVTSFQQEKLLQSYLYNKMIYKFGKLFLFPVQAKKIAVFNLINHVVTYIEIPEREGVIFYNVIEHNKKYILFPVVNGDYVYKLDLDTNKIVIIDKVRKSHIKKNRILNGNAIIGNDIILADMDTNNVITYNCCDYTKQIDIIKADVALFSTFSYNNVWGTLSNDGSILNFFKEKKLIKKIELSHTDNNSINKCMHYIGHAIVEDKLIILPGENEDVVLIKNNEIVDRIVLDIVPFKANSHRVQPFAVALCAKGCIVLLPYQTTKICIIKNNRKIEYIDCSMENHDKEMFIANYKNQGGIVYESKIVMKLFCDLIKNSDKCVGGDNDKCVKKNSDSGKKILKEMIRE